MILEIAMGIVLGFVLICLLPFAAVLIYIIFPFLALALLIGLAIYAFPNLPNSDVNWEDLMGVILGFSIVCCFGFLISDKGTSFLNTHFPKLGEGLDKIALRVFLIAVVILFIFTFIGLMER
jgi:hypothetical protein